MVVDATEGVTARGLLSLPLPTLAEARVPMLPMLVCEDVSEKPSPAASSPDPNSAFHLRNTGKTRGKKRHKREGKRGSVTSMSA